MTARWIPTGNIEEWYGEEAKCSACNMVTIDWGDYCPNCGARMESEDEE